MKILIVGAGAIGTFYGASLSREAECVTFLVRRQEQVDDIDREGVRIVDADGNAEVFPLKACLNVTSEDAFDLIIFATKVYDLENAFEKVRPCLNLDTVLCSIQNGVQHYDLLQKAFPNYVTIGAVSYSGLTKKNNTDVLNTGPVRTLIGDNEGGHEKTIETLKTSFEESGLNVRVQIPIKEAMWEKQVLTSMQQAIGAMTGNQFQELYASEHCKVIARQLYDEVITLAAAEGIELDEGTYDKVLKNWQNKPTHRPSMAVDFENGKVTESHMANGYIAELAESHGLQAPVNKAMYHLIKAIEESRS